MITFTVPGRPVGKGRHRTFRDKTGNTRAYTPAETVVYQNLVRLMASQVLRGEPPSLKPIYIEVRISITHPQSHFRTGKHAGELKPQWIDVKPMTKPDGDNVFKAITDALTGLAYKDDRQIYSHFVDKYYGLVNEVIVKVDEYQAL